MKIIDLKHIGLTEGEVRVYESLLDLGETTRTDLAKKSGISPSKIYDVANRLLEKGIISVVKKNKVLHFSAKPPDRLFDYLEQKEKDIEQEKELVEDLLPSLMRKYQKKTEKGHIEIIAGMDILNQDMGALRKKDVVRAIIVDGMELRGKYTLRKVRKGCNGLVVYRDYVVFVVPLAEPILIRINNSEAAESCRKAFDKIWKR
ncbi:MAG: TrmB family transcriptional regulator [Candidatus Nanoarchaeia archaeon]